MVIRVLLILTGAQSEPVARIRDAAPRDNFGATEPGIRITVSGLRDQSGRVNLEPYPADENDVLAGDAALLGAGKVFRRVVTAVPSRARAVTLCANVPRPGRYAVLVIHKRSGDRGLNLDDDGVSLPGNAHIGRHRPPFEQAIVTVSGGIMAAAAPMQYRCGLAGFKPVSE